MNVNAVLQSVIIAALTWCGAWLWSAEHRLKRIEYALGIEQVLPAKGKHHAQVVERAPD